MTLYARWVALLPLGWLVLEFVVRATDLVYTLDETSQLGPAPLAVGLVAVLGVFALAGLVVYERGPVLSILVAMAVLTWGPSAVLGSGWTEMGGVLCGAIVLAVPSRRAWLLFVAVAVADAGVHQITAGEFAPGLAAQMFSTAVNVGIALFAVTRLARLTDLTDQCRRTLASAVAKAERLRSTERLRDAVGERVSGIIRIAQDSRLAPPALADQGVTRIETAARESAREARSTIVASSDAPADLPPTGHIPGGVPLGFARRVLIALLGCYSVTSFGNAGQLDGFDSWAWFVLVSTTVVGCALQLYHGAPRAAGSAPRWWRWTLLVQFVLATPIALAVPPVAEVSIVTHLVIATLVIRLPSPWSWLSLGFVCAVFDPIYFASLGIHPAAQFSIIAATVIGSVTMYALFRLPALTRELRDTRDELTSTVVMLEQARLARDVHDLLGFHLSAITLSCDLAHRAHAEGNAERARTLLADIAEHADGALTQLRAIEESTRLNTAAEMHAGRALLTAASVEVETALPSDPLPAAADHTVAVIIREAVTNVVRHARAQRCTLAVRLEHSRVHVRVTNDGAGNAPADRDIGGNGLRNLRERAREVGGMLTTDLDGETFTVVAEVPA